MIDIISQILITALGLPALALMNTSTLRHRRLGVVLGLLGQPAWYIQLVINEQWAMLPVFAGYTLAWLFGLWNLWIKKPRSKRDAPLLIDRADRVRREDDEG